MKIESTKENGNIIKCMVSAKSNGLMGDVIKVSMRTTKSMDMEHFFGLMEENT